MASIARAARPNRPDLADEWTGQHLSGHAAHLRWEHNSKHADWFGFYQDVGGGFRADNGFVPQAGYREGRGAFGWQVHPKGFVSRQRTFLNVDYQYDRNGDLISRNVMPGFGMDVPRDGFMQFRYQDEQARAGDVVLGQRRIGYVAQFSPTRWLSEVGVDGLTGGQNRFRQRAPRPRVDDQRQRAAESDPAPGGGAAAEPALAGRRHAGRQWAPLHRPRVAHPRRPTRSRRVSSCGESGSMCPPIAIRRSTPSPRPRIRGSSRRRCSCPTR